jgi:hypothetical protein
MAKEGFRFGEIGNAIFIASVWCTFIVIWHFSEWLYHYLAFLVFIGVFLRPLLEVTGIADRLASWEAGWHEKRHGKYYRARRKAIEQEARDEKYKRARKRDPRLPKNW